MWNIQCADDNTPYVYDEVIRSLQYILLNFYLNGVLKVSQMKNISKKSRLLMSINEPVTINIGLEEIGNIRTEKILGLMFDRKLELETCIKQVSNKKQTLTRIG